MESTQKTESVDRHVGGLPESSRLDASVNGRAVWATQALVYHRLKIWPGRLLAIILFIVLLPLLCLLMVLVRLTSRGPAIYSQTRVGLRGRQFRIYKLRTMRVDAERDTGPVWAKPNDHRVTPLGRWLRKTHLDEIPQLWNVIRGDMCLIGPRPERPEIVERLVREIPGYMERHVVRPGITGLAQIHLPPDQDLDSVRRKLEYDLYYIRSANLWWDLRILLCTALRFVGLGGAAAARLCRVPAPSDSSTAVAPSVTSCGVVER